MADNQVDAGYAAVDPAARPSRASASPTASAATVASMYFGYFGALGVYGPFLALYLQRRGFAPRDAAYLLATLPVLRVLATPAWTLLADRLHSASVVLRVVSVGSFAAFALLELASGRTLVALALVLFTLFRSPSTALMDVLALDVARRTGGEFGRLRAWGTAGYTVCTFAAGVVIARFGTPAIVHVAVVLLGVAAALTLGLPRRGAAPTRVRLLPALAVLLRRPRFRFLVVSASLHQIGMAAYDSLYPAYVAGFSSAVYAGAAVAVGATAEVAFMAQGRRFLARVGLTRTLALAYGAGALRWALLAVLRAPAAIVAAQVLHGIAFGGFYLACVAAIDEDSPPAVRASAQGVFAALVWGLASALALALAGWLQSHWGMPWVFLAAMAGSGVAAVLAWRAR